MKLARFPGLRRLARDTRAVTVIEFALLAPTLMVLMMGGFDLGYNTYTTAELQGAIQKAARDSSIEAAATSQAAIDGTVTTAVHAIVPGATLTFTRTAYTDFTQVARPEDFNDLNNNGVCDNGEPFEDLNGNGVWDSTTGTSGFGQARDAVLYTVGVTYPRAFPIAWFVPGMPKTVNMKVSTVLRNQPYSGATATTIPVGNCP